MLRGMDLVAERADLVVELALQEHRRVVRDVDGSPDVLRYYHEGLRWGWQRSYRNRHDQWCGAFAAYCWGRGGLLPDIRLYDLASTGRLRRWAYDTPRWHRPQDTRPGDILLLGGEDGPSHIGLAVTGCVLGRISTVEGNSVGTLGDGTRGEGVVTHDRTISGPYRVHAAIRPFEVDLEAALPLSTPPAAPPASSQRSS